MKPTHYALDAAGDDGRIAALNFLVARSRWPLTIEPSNPHKNEYLAKAWQDAFDAQMVRARMMIRQPGEPK